MKAQIHPTYFDDAVVRCLCGNSFVTGSTQKDLKTEVCSVCHPFFSGQHRIVDTQGQVERFQKRQQRKK
jgi:large subunit ribosomal protein L31